MARKLGAVSPSPSPRRPIYSRFIGAGVLIGALLGLAVGLIGPPPAAYSTATVVLLFLVIGALFGGLLGGLIGVLLERG